MSAEGAALQGMFTPSVAPYSLSAALLPQIYNQLCRGFWGGMILGTHRPVTNKPHLPLDGLPKTFERGSALWSDNE
jgi:hypothetical protein